MIIEIGRKDSCGLKGTYDNAHHHANNLIPLIDKVSKLIPSMGFAVWTQFNNVHVLTTKEGTKYCLRPLRFADHDYAVRLCIKLSRSNEIRLFDFNADEIDRLLDVLYGLAEEKLMA